MAIYFKTETPNKLLNTFKKAIDDGHIRTWAYDEAGDFTHTADQWNKKAWLRPEVRDKTALAFFIIKPEGVKISSEVYAIYHGRFIESMVRHCDTLFTNGSATAMPEGRDTV